MVRFRRFAVTSAVTFALIIGAIPASPASAQVAEPEPTLQPPSESLPRNAVTPVRDSGTWFEIDHRTIDAGSKRHGTRGRQSLIKITSVRARQRFAFDVALPSGSHLEPRGGGLVAVDESGLTSGALEAPWAVDADGVEVSTRFEVVDRDTFVQVVEHRPLGATYPVFADPWWVVPVALRAGAQLLGRYVVRRATYEAAKRAAARMAAREAERSIEDVEARTPLKLLKLNRKNFRENVRRRTGWAKSSIEGYHAHHTLPIKFQADFNRAGLNIHNPVFGHWWCARAHIRTAPAFNRAWERWLRSRRDNIRDTRWWRRQIENKRIRIVSRDWSNTYQCP